ncbi:MAG: RluA family pseudouridine synthase [Eubacteriales bacterium]|nr:RluA family pseudouridine synthase [Eubacteriales bacterium]
MREFTANKNDEGKRLDRFVTKAAPLLPMSLMQKYIRIKRIKVNGKRAEKDYRLMEGDKIEMYINDEFFASEPAAAAPASFNDKGDGKQKAVSSSLNIVHEDDDLILINKPSGMACHPYDGAKKGETLIDIVKAYLIEKGDWDPARETTFVPALCNRIDRNTSGIVIAAKNAHALASTNEKIKNREITKKYLLIVHGVPAKKESIIEGYLVKNERTNTVALSDKPVNDGKLSKTKYRVLREKDGMALVECELITGRSHQIRVMMASIGHPLLGDHKYGMKDSRRYQALCAYKLTIDGKTYEIKPDFNL